MSSRQLHSNGDSDGLNQPPTTRKGKGKKSTQPTMEQQQDQLQHWATVQLSPVQNQPPRPASTQPTVGKISCPHCRPDRQIPLNTTARCQSDATTSSKHSAPSQAGHATSTIQ